MSNTSNLKCVNCNENAVSGHKLCSSCYILDKNQIRKAKESSIKKPSVNNSVNNAAKNIVHNILNIQCIQCIGYDNICLNYIQKGQTCCSFCKNIKKTDVLSNSNIIENKVVIYNDTN